MPPSPLFKLNTCLNITCKRHALMRPVWCRRAHSPLQALSDGPIAPIVRNNDFRAWKSRAPQRRIEAEGGGGSVSGGSAPSFRPIDLSQPGKHSLKVARPPKDVALTEAFGPRGLLLVGLSQPDCGAVRSWMQLAGRRCRRCRRRHCRHRGLQHAVRATLQACSACDTCAAALLPRPSRLSPPRQAMEPGFSVSPCPTALLEGGTLRAALLGNAGAAGDGSGEAALDGGRIVAEHAWESPPAWAPSLVFFSGMGGQEVLAVIEHWGECTGEPACLGPKDWRGWPSRVRRGGGPRRAVLFSPRAFFTPCCCQRWLSH